MIHDRSGQAIAEAIVALAILAIGYMAVLALLNRSLSITQVVSDQNIATYLASEGIEIVKNLSDANIKKGNSYNEGFGVGSYEVSYLTELESDNSSDGDNDNPGFRIGNQSDFSPDPLRFSPALGYSYDLASSPQVLSDRQDLAPRPALRSDACCFDCNMESKGRWSIIRST